MRLRVATFNIRNGRAFDGLHSWPLRRRATLAAIVGLDAEVIGLQEAYRFQLRWLGRGLPGHLAVGAGRSVPWPGEHCAIVVRRARARVVSTETRWFGDRPTEPGARLPDASAPRIYTSADLELLGGPSLRVVDTHLDERSADRRVTSLRQLAATVDPSQHTVVLGDLNLTPDDPALGALLDVGLRPARPDPERGTSHRFTGRTDRRRIDHIFVSAGIEVVGASIVTGRGPWGRLPSDHWPLVADLEVG